MPDKPVMPQRTVEDGSSDARFLPIEAGRRHHGRTVVAARGGPSARAQFALFAAASAAGALVLAPAAHAEASWTGAYVGVAAGGGSETISAPGVTGLRPSGALGDIEAGYNRQFGKVVLGVEGDVFPLPGLPGHASAPCPASLCGGLPATLETSVRTQWAASIGGSVGFPIARAGRWLPYATAGYHLEDVKVDNAVVTPLGTVASSQTARGHGWFVGGGVRYALSRRLWLGAKYLYAPSTIAAFNARSATHLVLIDLSWKL